MTMLSRACVSPYWYFIEAISVCRTVSEIFSVKEWRDLDTGSRGRSKSLKMAPFDRPLSSYLTLNNRDLERSLKVIHTGTIVSLGALSYSPSIVTMAVSLYSASNLKNWLGVVQGH